LRTFTIFRDARLYACATSYLTRKPVALVCKADCWAADCALFSEGVRTELCLQAALRVALQVREAFGRPNWLHEAKEMSDQWWNSHRTTTAHETVVILAEHLKFTLCKTKPWLFFTKAEYERLQSSLEAAEQEDVVWEQRRNDPNFVQDWQRQQELGYRWVDGQWEFDD
jgi:hypothetical protein